MGKSKRIKVAFTLIISFFLVCAFFLMGINVYVRASVSKRIISPEQALKIENTDCVLVLGCGVHGDEPSDMLEDRLLKGLEIYNSGAAEKILMSGDHGQTNYDEVNVMKKFAENRGVDSKDIFMDHAGFSTYDSLYRARDVFCCKKIIIVTQKYHLHRALYIAERLGLEAYGVNSDQRNYTRYLYRETREILARDKDFIKCIFKPQPVYLGEKIPITGDGNATNDK